MFHTDDDIDIQKEIDSLLTMLKTPVDRSVLEADLKRYLNRYLMDIEHSKRAIIKEHGGTDSDYIPPDADMCQIKDVVCNRDCTLVAKVIGINRIVTMKGKRLQTIGLSDDTGIIPIEMWEKEAKVEIGKTYKFRNCRIKYSSFNDTNVVNCDPKDILECDDTIKSSAYDIIRPLAVGPEGLVGGINNLVISGNILEIEYDRYNNGAVKSSGYISLDGIPYRFFAYHEKDLTVGEEVLIDRVKTEYNGEIYLVMMSASFVYRGV